MQEKSHVDSNKIEQIPSGNSFEYKDVVVDGFSVNEQKVDRRTFKREVEDGIYDSVFIYKDSGSHVLYKKR